MPLPCFPSLDLKAGQAHILWWMDHSVERELTLLHDIKRIFSFLK